MSKVKYYYDSETLSYRKIEHKKGRKTGLFILSFMGVLLSGFLLMLLFLNLPNFETPKEKELNRELTNLEFQVKLLNKKMNQAETVLTEIAERDNNLYRIYFEASPIPKEQRRAGFGGVNRYKDLEGYNSSEMIINTTKEIDILSKMLVVQSNSLEEIQELAERKEELLAAIPSIQPVRKEDLKRMASGFGWRIDPFTKARKKHYGMDFSAVRGTPIYATGDGKVVRADNRASGYGNHIRIDHGFGYISLYAHMSKYNVKRGQKVKRGDIIGYVGNTGRSVGSHLHYEILKDNKKINPLNFYYGNLSTSEFDALLAQASQENQSFD